MPYKTSRDICERIFFDSIKLREFFEIKFNLIGHGLLQDGIELNNY